MLQIHIDLETYDVIPTAQILSIGACACSTESEFPGADVSFYEEIDLGSYELHPEFTTSQSTIEWWEKRGGFVPTKEPVSWQHAIHLLTEFFGRALEVFGADDFEVWANYPQFDLAILGHHYRRGVWRKPWEFYQEFDVSTVRNMSRQLNLGIEKPEPPHHALGDARQQMEFVRRVQSTLAHNVQTARAAVAGYSHLVNK